MSFLSSYDPQFYDAGRTQGRIDLRIANFVGFFIENLQGSDVVGRVVPMTGLIRGRLEENAEVLEFKCVEFSEELLYGHLRKRPTE